MADVLLRGGLACDPQAGTQQVADVLVGAGRVVAVGPELTAPVDAEVVDVSGLVVGPGFVDLHSHVHSVAGHRLHAFDGVTTALDLEAGMMPVERAYRDAAAEGRPLNYGFSASWAAARGQVLVGFEPDASLTSTLALLSDPAWRRSSTPA
ncbi:MAG: amidohydrolase family protein, partial [Micromonosporaceae bacterium]|nr:amidohydrolase family protein [Micromonosporaceae bacterium]